MAKFVLTAVSGSRHLSLRLRPAWQSLLGARLSTDSSPPEGPNVEPPIPPYKMKVGESMELKRARLLYQSRKRGMLENGLLLSTFAGKFLDKLDEKQLEHYDRLINMPTNDWEIYYWVTGVKPTPAEYDSSVMDLLKEHARNEDKESRISQPNLPSS